jgi:hypothetical protein
MSDVTTQPAWEEILLPTMWQALNALARAADDLARAALILRQESRPPGQRFRSPDDLCRIAGQFSNTAQICGNAQDAVSTAGNAFTALRAAQAQIAISAAANPLRR